MLLLFFAILVSCGVVPTPLETGTWTLRGAGVVGHLSTLDGCKIALWGERWGTSGEASVPCELRGGESDVWVEFDIETSVGGGVGTIQTAKGAAWAVLPLGSRVDEWEVQLQRVPGTLSEAEVTESAARASIGRQELAAGWTDGGLLLSDEAAQVGELLLRGDGLVEIEVYDERWLSAGRQVAETTSLGPDLYLSFPVMPAFAGEFGGIIVNRVLGEAVVPLGEEVTPADRRLHLSPGVRTEAEREALVGLAKAAAVERERIVLHPMAMALYEEHTSVMRQQEPDQALLEACSGWVQSDQWSLQLVGYEVSFLVGESGGCELWIEPSPVQHLRRISLGVVDGQIVEALHDL